MREWQITITGLAAAGAVAVLLRHANLHFLHVYARLLEANKPVDPPDEKSKAAGATNRKATTGR